MSNSRLDRRSVLGMGAAFMIAGAQRAAAGDGDLTVRLAELQRDGRVSGLHTLLVSRGGKQIGRAHV